MTDAAKIGRKPFFYAELQLNSCSLEYAVTCNAPINPGLECFNTYATCKDKDSYTKVLKSYLFGTNKVKNVTGIDMFPVLSGYPTITPVKLEPLNGVGQRGAVSITLKEFQHNDAGIDPYKDTRLFTSDNGFFAKLRRRNPFYNNAPLKLISGYIDDSNALIDVIERLYFVTAFDGANKNGEYTITAKDILKFTQDKRAIVPEQKSIMLGAPLAAGAMTMTLRAGDGVKWPVENTICRIDDELLYVDPAFITGDSITISARGWSNSIDEEHDTGAPLSQIETYGNRNVIDAIYQLLTNECRINPIYIPYNNNPADPDEWDTEKANWLIDSNIGDEQPVNEPRQADKVLSELCRQFSISLWWNEREQKIKLSGSAISLGNEEPLDLNDQANILIDSFDIREDINNRFSQVWIYYDQLNGATDISKKENYRNLEVYINPDAESEHAYDEVNIKEVYGNWLDDSNALLVPDIARKIISKDLMQEYFVSFELDAKDAANLWTGQYCLLKTDSVVNEFGKSYIQKVHITQVQELEAGSRFKYTGLSNAYLDPDIYGGFIFIARDDLIDYDSSSEADKNTNFFLSDGDQPFSDARPPYIITE